MGLTTSPSGRGVYGGGTSTAAGGQIGVRGETVTGVGVQGQSFGSNAKGFLGGNDPLFNRHVGVYGESDQNGIVGKTASDGDSGVFGENDGTGDGVHGFNSKSHGLGEQSDIGTGVFGQCKNGHADDSTCADNAEYFLLCLETGRVHNFEFVPMNPPSTPPTGYRCPARSGPDKSRISLPRAHQIKMSLPL
jgi:hypothetical protein